MTAEHDEASYDFRAIEAKWQQRWREDEIFRAGESADRPKFYGLEFFPYPSGAGISVGHCRNYVPMDVFCRYRRMQGDDVLHPMGWDAFGQPAENEAIKQGRNPREMVPEYAAHYRRQLDLVGLSYDWSREINSSEPDFYRWTQWFFLLLYRRGLAYRASTPINWCPVDKTGLANEEVVAGRCWRCGSPIEKRAMPQWYFRITEYAERLLSGLDTIDWPDGIKLQQREWIGRSEGAEVEFAVESGAEPITVFTTRPDTLWGATFIVLAPEHPLVDAITTPAAAEAVSAYRDRAARATEIERLAADRAKTGVATGAFAVNPVNGERIPIWIADYVLMGYGTGAIMAVPAHDQRDFEFARKYDIAVTRVYQSEGDADGAHMEAAEPEGGVMRAFQPGPNARAADFPFAGLPNSKETVARVIDWLEQRSIGRRKVQYRLRDWLISRQRYWGAPIPIVHCPVHGEVPVPEADLPVLLPPVENYQPTGTGESPLAAIPEFVQAACPTCGGPARRETDTMGGFACSSWYFLRFADPHNLEAPFSREAIERWLPVDLYAGGAEHAVMHLLYSRFWTKVMHDAGLIGFDEPFTRLRNQGMLLAHTAGRAVTASETAEAGDESDAGEPLENWKVLRPEERATVPQDQWVWRWVKMSKSMGNVVTPDAMTMQFGADSLRVCGLFAAPFEDTVQWSTGGIEAAHRWVHRFWRLWHDLRPHYDPDWREHAPSAPPTADADRALRRKLHQTIRKVGHDIDGFRFNTAVAALHELTNEISAWRNALGSATPDRAQALLASEVLETAALLIAPMMPHAADELWEQLGLAGYTLWAKWPDVDEAAAAEESVSIAIQVNGKVRGRIEVPPGTAAAELERLALAEPSIAAELDGRAVRKVFAVPERLVNIVAG